MTLAFQFAVGCAGPETVYVRREVYLMGTTASLEVLARDRALGLEHLEEFIRIIEDTEGQLSTWQETSDLSRFNRREVGTAFRLDQSLCRLFRDLETWVDRTDGSFDPGIGRLIDAWGLHTSPRWPDETELSIAMSRTGFNQLRFNATSCEASRLTDVQVDAGGFGKGEALDRIAAAAQLRRTGSWKVDIGGQVMVGGSSPPSLARAVALAHPRFRDQAALDVELSAGSLATSGGSERDAVTPAGRIGHILDPLTGQTVSRSESVVVWHSSALVADILSTALYVMGMDKGLPWAEGEGFAVSFLLPVDGRVEHRMTSRFRTMFVK